MRKPQPVSKRGKRPEPTSKGISEKTLARRKSKPYSKERVILPTFKNHPGLRTPPGE